MNQKECTKSYNWFQIFCPTEISLFYENIYSLYEFDEKLNYKKTSKFFNFEGKGYKEKDFFLKPFDKTIVFKGVTMFSLRCRSHVQEKILPKNMFGCPLKFIFGIFRNFYLFNYKPKYSYTIMYECENSLAPHELS
jgi:hypothetical protein